MSLVLNLRYNLISKIEYISHKKYFNEIYSFILAALTVIFWRYNTMTGMITLASFSAVVILLTNDLKYILPSVLYIIFTLNHGFKVDEVPYNIIIAGGIFFLVLITYTIFNGIKIRNLKSFIGLFGLAIFQIIPIFWNNTITDQKVLYILYFADLMYLLLYVIFASGIKKNSVDLMATAMSYLGVVIAIECAFRVYELKDTVDNILSLSYFLGWGLCNEAGILICFSIPFTFYLISKSRKARFMFYHNFKIIISITGIILTTSRGAYLFGFIEIIVLYITTFIVSKNKLKYAYFILMVISFILIMYAILNKYAIQLINDILDKVFYNDLDDNGRKELWIRALELLNLTPRNVAFGNGMVSDIVGVSTAEGYQISMQVYHSSVFETLAISGLCGFFFLLVHFIDKYKNMTLVNKNFMYIMTVGFLLTDLYGFIDNTYHMYYYMIPLVLIMASIDSQVYSVNPYKLF